MTESKNTQKLSEDLAVKLKELRDLHKLSVISDEEFERRSYILLHTDEKSKSEPAPAKVTINEELALQLKELRDLHKLSIISDDEFEKRTYNLLHEK